MASARVFYNHFFTAAAAPPGPDLGRAILRRLPQLDRTALRLACKQLREFVDQNTEAMVITLDRCDQTAGDGAPSAGLAYVNTLLARVSRRHGYRRPGQPCVCGLVLIVTPPPIAAQLPSLASLRVSEVQRLSHYDLASLVTVPGLLGRLTYLGGNTISMLQPADVPSIFQQLTSLRDLDVGFPVRSADVLAPLAPTLTRCA